MQFAVALPLWILLFLAAAVAVVAWGTYAGAIVAMPRRRRILLTTIRALALLLLLACVLRPVRILPPDAPAAAVIAVLLDTSRSMGVGDANDRPRIETAHTVVDSIRSSLAGRFDAEMWTFGAALEESRAEAWTADAPRSDLSGALKSLRERYRDRRLAATIVISDGGDTGAEDAAAVAGQNGVPVYTIGVGSGTALDLEVLDVTAGDASVTGSSIDLAALLARRGGAEPFDVRILENGRPIDVRRVTPAGDGTPMRAVFSVSPPRETATVYTVEIPTAAGELVGENNRRSVLVEPPGRLRRILVVEGAPGFDHTFLKRALAEDPGIELDSVVRKGNDAAGNPTFSIQAAEDRASRLATGFPADRATLFHYDAIVLANIESALLSTAQVDMASAFVAERGGGMLVLGAKSLAPDGIAATRLDEVLPLGLADRSAGVLRIAAPAGPPFAVHITPEGESHPVMRIGTTPGETANRWRAVPAVSGAAGLGAPRPGAQILAMVQAPDGMRPLVAIQRYGRGRSMVFTGEASWRWRMQMPSDDRTYEVFWRQTARWLAAAAPDVVHMEPFPGVATGEAEGISVEVRDPSFVAITDATAIATVTLPDGATREVKLAPVDTATGRYSGEFRFEEPGIYRIVTEARRGSASLGTSQRSALAGGADEEMTDPRLNDDLLRRVSAASGGQYVAAGDVNRLASLLPSTSSQPSPPRLQDLWHNGWIFGAIVLLLGAEWVLRRRFGLR